MKKRIAILAGGESDEINVSLKSAQTIYQHLSEFYIVEKVIATESGWYVELPEGNYPINKSNFSYTLNDKTLHFDCVYITIHGTPGENGIFQGYFELIKQKYTGPNLWAASTTFNKWACNQLLKALGFNIAQSEIHTLPETAKNTILPKQVGYPLFVKPNDSGSSFGVSKVNNEKELYPAIAHAFKHGKEVIIEKGLSGTEVTSGVYKTLSGEIIALPITEIVSENDFFDYEAKYEGKSSEITPARLSERTTQLIQNTTVDIYKKLNLNGVVRIDYIIENEQPFVIEINTTPGMSPASIIPQQATAANIPLGQILQASVENSLVVSIE